MLCVYICTLCTNRAKYFFYVYFIFIPGCIFTACVLSYGIYSFSKGRSQMSQKMMRLRIVAQGATIVALVGGVMMGAGQKI